MCVLTHSWHQAAHLLIQIPLGKPVLQRSNDIPSAVCCSPDAAFTEFVIGSHVSFLVCCFISTTDLTKYDSLFAHSLSAAAPVLVSLGVRCFTIFRFRFGLSLTVPCRLMLFYGNLGAVCLARTCFQHTRAS